MLDVGGVQVYNYVQINPDLEVHTTHTQCVQPDLPIPEHTRVAFSRMRLSSHRLRIETIDIIYNMMSMIETGRWARIPRDQRLCGCGEVQDEGHVSMVLLSIYPRVLRAESVGDFKYIYDVMSFFCNV